MSTIAEKLKLLRSDAGLQLSDQAAPTLAKAPPSSACRQLLPPAGEADHGWGPAETSFSRWREKVPKGDEGGQAKHVLPNDVERVSPLPQDLALFRQREKEKQIEALRRLIRTRERQPKILQPRGTLTPPAGEEIAPGLHYVETVLKYEATETIEWPAIDESPIDRRRLLCFDTETTGLAGGVGTRAFMIGVAAWQEGKLTVRQLYLTTIAGERAMLQTFASWLNADTVLVSYNGKSYDAPLLKGRLRLNRIDHRLAELSHIDWLHPTRRVYKGQLPNCKLATIEREVLRIIREDDLPGSEAPAAWLAYLRGQSSTNLSRVLDHNRQDVITLMRLGDHLTTRQSSP